MIRPIVMCRVKGADGDERASVRGRVKAEFESLRGQIPGMRHLEVGLDTSGIDDDACDVVLVTEFASSSDLDAYASHPEHRRVRDNLAGLRIARHQVDYE